MSWTPDSFSGGFTKCSSDQCKEILSLFQIDSSEINVKVNDFYLKRQWIKFV